MISPRQKGQLWVAGKANGNTLEGSELPDVGARLEVGGKRDGGVAREGKLWELCFLNKHYDQICNWG